MDESGQEDLPITTTEPAPSPETEKPLFREKLANRMEDWSNNLQELRQKKVPIRYLHRWIGPIITPLDVGVNALIDLNIKPVLFVAEKTSQFLGERLKSKANVNRPVMDKSGQEDLPVVTTESKQNPEAEKPSLREKLTASLDGWIEYVQEEKKNLTGLIHHKSPNQFENFAKSFVDYAIRIPRFAGMSINEMVLTDLRDLLKPKSNKTE